MISRFFCPSPLTFGATVELPAEVAHHAVNVLKVGAGETAILFDGRGGEWLATLSPAGKSSKPALYATLTEFNERDNESPLHITLVQALPASDKMDWVVQKAVELGVARIQPVMTQRSVMRLSGERATRRVTHWRIIAIGDLHENVDALPLLEPHARGADVARRRRLDAAAVICVNRSGGLQGPECSITPSLGASIASSAPVPTSSRQRHSYMPSPNTTTSM